MNVILPEVKLSEFGEFALIELIHDITGKFKNIQQTSWQQLLIGIGDDTAAWQGDNHIQLATTDSMVQGTHFDLNNITWEELGWKAMAVNLSDIAAMGGTPKYALLSVALPGELEVENVAQFCHSTASLAAKFGVAIVGGNVSTAPNIVITITVFGSSKTRSILKRSTATPGEQIAVTGSLGLSAAGLKMFKEKINLDAQTAGILRKAHLQPVPRIKEGQILAQHGVKTAIDISDGLIADLEHICEASKVGAKIKVAQVPVHPLVKANFPDYRELALYGGEDYELLFTADRNIIAQVRKALNYPIAIIGDIVEEALPDRITLLDHKGNTIPANNRGWEHFRSEIPEDKFV